MITLVKNELKRQKNVLSSRYPACSEREEEDHPSVREALLKITTHVLENMNRTDLAKKLQDGKR